jgi:4-amino-4-deoxy-L-arabinose transferase-like glycosyltransferase
MFTFAVAVVALLPRLYVALVWAKEPVWDGHYYHYGAVRIAEGLGYSEDVIRHGISQWKPWTHYPVGYSGFLAACYAILGPHNWVAPLFNALTGTGLVVLIHRLAKLTLGLWRGRLAAVITTIHPGLIAYSAVVMTEPLAGTLVVLAAYFIVRAPERKLSLLLSGTALALAVLVRPSSLLAAPLLMVLFPLSFWRGVTRTAIVSALCILFVLPWTLRNCFRMDGCAFVSTNAGWNLAIGALTKDGRFRTLRAVDGCPVVTGQVQQDQCWWNIGIQVIRRDAAHFLAMAPKKLAQTFDHESFVVEYLHEADPTAWPEELRQKGREWLSRGHRALVIVAMFCVTAGIRWRRVKSLAFVVQSLLILALLFATKVVIDNDEHPYYLLIVATCTLFWLPLPGRPRHPGMLVFSVGFIALTALTHIAFFGDDRYHLVVTPLLCLCAAAAFGPEARPHHRITSRQHQAGPLP